jgi:hypothetical protein
MYPDWGYGQQGALLLDLDETLVRTNLIETLRSQRRWREVTRSLSRTSLPPKTREFVELARRVQ